MKNWKRIGYGLIVLLFSFDIFGQTQTNLWVEITTVSNNQAYLTIHNANQKPYHEMLFSTNLLTPWTFNEEGGWGTLFGASSNIVLNPLPITGNQQMFFRALAGVAQVRITSTGGTTAIRPASTNGSGTNVTFSIGIYTSSTAPSPGLVVNYQISGSAVNGIDYSNLTGTTTIPAGSYFAPPLVIQPFYSTNGFDVSATLTLSLPPASGLGYLLELDDVSVSALITDPPINFTVVTNLESAYAAGIAYQPVQNALIVSVNNLSGEPNNFVLIGTNGSGALTMTNWSDVAGAPNEVEIATVKKTTNGFILGETYFGDGAVIDKLSPDGSQWNMGWCSLTNATETDTSGINGIYSDDSGTFGGGLIAVTGQGGVWLIQSDTNGNAHPTLLTNTPTTQLSGVITLTNDVSKWGPWAGKIITGDSDGLFLYAIDTNGILTTYDTSTMVSGGIAIEAFALIRTNEDLYFVDAGQNEVLKISGAAFGKYTDDLLITQTATHSDPEGFGPPADLFIIAWDSVNSVFKVRKIPAGPGILEDATFAPINLPSQ